MLRKILIVGVSAGLSASVPIIYQVNPELFGSLVETTIAGQATDPQSVSAVPQLRLTSAEPAPLGRKVVVTSDPRGHFAADFKLNGRTVTALVDTGATLVAINMSTAKRIGIRVQPSDFRYRVATANGEIQAASVVIDTLQIGRIHVDNVQAVVLEDKALSGTLIGMSFLKRLGKYGVEDGAMLLVQ
jgi:aspartyl protease family protein